MFRQIEINPEETHFQKFLWKKGLNETVLIYKLKTITYMQVLITTPGRYLSTLVLIQLAIDKEDNFPIAANIVRQDVYSDHILNGCFTLKELEIRKSKLLQLFESAGMSLAQMVFLTLK
ncbi:hypothetical protein NPIL_202741 [Nephila pilipes]|uniref:Uncharacterized protein n=1 Tax=Nephila pilipes TaxID=299642 RepID=A0A8X6Q6V7_NEPPI|nr:hypothetical protein NPIL_202741 [Nephila pilipes]